MKIIIDGKTYAAIRALTFAPEVDLTGDSISLDEFTADVATGDSVAIAQYARLCDDRDNLWAKYWITYAEHIDRHTLRLRAVSPLVLIDQVTLPACMYAAEPVANVLEDTLGNLGAYTYELDSGFASETVTGFCPEQSARERLLWVCFSMGGYVRSCFSDKIEILPISESEALVPMERTFWKPSITFSDHVTAVQARYYSFAPGTPAATDRWVADGGGDTYIVTEQTLSLSNPYAPSGAPENTVTIEGVYLLHSGNVAAALSRLAQWYFNRTALDFSAIDNAEYLPGQKVVVCADEESLYAGYIERCDFSFGAQARANIHLTAVASRQSGRLVIDYVWEGVRIGQAVFLLPVGYSYSITNPYIDLFFNEHRYVFRPENEMAEGTIAAGANDVEEPCQPALDLYRGVLDIISVDGVEADEGGVVTIA